MTNETSDQVRRPIWLKLAVFAALLAVLATVAIGAVLTRTAAQTLKANGREYRLALAEDVSETVEAAVAQAQVDLLTATGMLASPDLPPDARLSWLLSHVASSTFLDHVDVYGMQGEWIDRVSEDGARVPAKRNELPAATRDAVLAAPGVAHFGVSFDEGGHARLEMVATIRPQNGTPTGFVASLISLRTLQSRVDFIEEHRLPTEHSRMLVVDAAQRVVAGGGAGSTLKHPMLENAAMLLDKQLAQSGEVSIDGVPKLASVLPYPSLGWFVIVEVPEEEAYASLRAMTSTIWIGVLVVLLLAVLGSLLGARAIARPLQQLAAFGRQLARREFDARVKVDTRDEVGLLADVMNEAAHDLRNSEEQIKRDAAIRADLGRYLPVELVDAVVRREQDMELGGLRAPITVLFADIVRFTPLCETLPPEDVVALLNEFFTIVTEIVFRHGGTVDKFVGDSVMAFWGAPTPMDDHADRALRAAEDIVRWLEVGNDAWSERYGTRLDVAIGVNTGDPIVGNIGSDTRMEYTIIGESVNVAARLEALARPNQILTTESTRECSREYEFSLVTEDVMHVGGEPMPVFEVLV